jgi:DUF4097 and DUF4098 domain-containing protein YvlB
MLLTAGAPAAEEGHFERTLRVTGPVELDVHTGSGSIEVRAGDVSTVRVSGTIRPSPRWFDDGAETERKVRYLESHPPIEQHGNIIEIGHLEDYELKHNISISYEIVTPAETRLRTGTGSGNQTVEGIGGPLEASTGSGGIRIVNLGDMVKASTGSGNIRIEGAKGSVRASTGSGYIHATGIAGGLRASTGSGDVTFEQTAPGDVEVNTGSGRVELRGAHGSVRAQTASGNISVEGEGSGSWRLGTASGDVTVRLPANEGFTLHARTVSGSIHTEREMTVQGTLSRHELEGKVGEGGFLLDVRTTSGNIRIE